MSKRLDHEHARYDVLFLDSHEYLDMPPRIRNHAYLYLLALTGWSRRHLTDGIVGRSVAVTLARRMGQPAERVLDVLQTVGLVMVNEERVTIEKYAKWQQTKAEVEAIRTERTTAGRAGGIQSGLARASKAEAIASRLLPHETKQNPTREEKSREEKSLNAPPTPSARRLDAFEDEPTVELAKGMHQVFQRALSPLDVIECQAALNQYAYLTATDLIARAHEHVDYCKDHTPRLPIPRTVAGFSDTWRRHNDYRADHGNAKADRVLRTATPGLTKTFPVAS